MIGSISHLNIGSNLNQCVTDIWSIMCTNELHVSMQEILDLVPEVFRMKFEPGKAIRVH
jgi:hypothetical protein